MLLVGMNPYAGLFTKAQFKQGKIPNPGTKGVMNSNGDTKEFVVVKIASGTLVNGMLYTLDGALPGVAVTASGNPIPQANSRVGVLCFASATATSTFATTAFAWAQIYGVCKAMVSATASAPGLALAAKANGHLAQLSVGLSASAVLQGITVMTTQSGTALTVINVMLNYPRFSGPPDANLA